MADNRINIIIEAKDRASGTLKSTGRSIDDLGDSSTRSASRVGALGTVGGIAFGAMQVAAVGAAVGIAAAATSAITAAADYEQSLNVFRSVSSATSAQMTEVASTARALGQDISLPGISAKDAAFAMVELAKAGLSVNDTLKASKGVLSLAKAGQLDTAEAASIAANALNAFSLSGDQATRVADLLAAGANASSADVRDMAFSLQMSAAQAAAVKVPVEDLTTAIALMSNNGIKGSDAGTSLKTMFMNLIPTTDRAKDSMRDLGLDFYDARGNFIGMRAAVDQLQRGTAKLTDEQKALHIENIFGADSSRAVNILLKEGVDGYDKLHQAVTKTGAATDLASAQNAGFKGALDNLRSSVETVSIDIGSQLLPKLTDLLDKVGPSLVSAITVGGSALVGFFDVLVGIGQIATVVWAAITDAFNRLVADLRPSIDWLIANVWPALQQLGAWLGSQFKQAFNEMGDAISSVNSVLADAGLNVNVLSIVLVALAVPIIATVVAVGVFVSILTAVALAIAKVIQFNSWLIQTFIDVARTVGATVSGLWGGAVDGFNSFRNNAVKWAQDTVNSIVGYFTSLPSRIGAAVANAVSSASSSISGLVGGIKLPGFSSGGFTGTGATNDVAGVVHRGEYVIPKNQVDQSTGQPKAFGGGNGGGDTHITITGNITIETPEAATAFWDRIDQSARLSRLGMAS